MTEDKHTISAFLSVNGESGNIFIQHSVTMKPLHCYTVRQTRCRWKICTAFFPEQNEQARSAAARPVSGPGRAGGGPPVADQTKTDGTNDERRSGPGDEVPAGRLSAAAALARSGLSVGGLGGQRALCEEAFGQS